MISIVSLLIFHGSYWTKFSITWLTATEYLNHKWPRVCFIYRNHNPTLSSFMTYHLVCSKSNTMYATSGTGTAYHSGAPDSMPVRVARSLVYCVVHCISLFVPFPLVIALSVFPFTASDCPFAIFWSLCYLSLHLQLLIASLISFGHFVICPSIYGV
jgi:hypothetical protein